MKTTVVHRKNCRVHQNKIKRICRPGIFGNPFSIGKDGTREEVIAKYRVYFYDRIANDPVFRRAVEGLRGYYLGCWCSPLACHGDVIVEYLERERR